MDASLPATNQPRAVDELTLDEAKKLTADEILKLTFPEDKLLYTPHEKWAWTSSEDFLSDDSGTPLGSGLEGQAVLKVSYIDDRQLVYISKMTSVWDTFKSFFASLYLNASSKYLRPLQGDCVPWVISVNHCLAGRVSVSLSLPHPTGWREADMFLKESQKEAIIAAYQKLHARGVLHADAEYRHWLIGDDEKITIIDFGLSKVVGPDEWALKAGLEGCSPSSIRTEMRKVKFMLDWKDSRATEFRLAKLRAAREARDRAAADAALRNSETNPFDVVEVPKEPLSEEEQQEPDGGLRLTDLETWSYGNSWTATRFEVDCHQNEVGLKKSKVPRPPIPSEITTTESTGTVAKDKALVSSSSLTPAIKVTSSASAAVIDSTASGSVSNNPSPDKPDDSETLHQQPKPNVGSATSAIPRFLRGDHLKSMMEHLVVWRQKKGQKGQAKENNEAIEEGKRDGEGKDPEGKGGKAKEQKQKSVNLEPVKTVLRHGKADHVKLNPGKGRVVEPPAKEPDVSENVSEKWTPINLESTRTVTSRQGNTNRPRTSMKRRIEAEVQGVDRQTESNGPAKKRQRIASRSHELGGRNTPNLSSEMDAEDSDGISSAGLTSSGSSTSSDEGDIMRPMLEDEDADPTPYEINPEERVYLRREAARAFARFTAASTRVRTGQRGRRAERRNLERSRSELLRIMVMLPMRHRTTLWTNMGQPDIQTLLGLVPKVPGLDQQTEPSLPQPARAEVAPQGNGPTRPLCLGPLTRHVALGGSDLRRMPSMQSGRSLQGLGIAAGDVESSTKEILRRRLEIERQRDRIAMPPPPVPFKMARWGSWQTMNTAQTSSITSMRPPVYSPRDLFQQGSSSRPLSAAPQAPTRSSTSAQLSAASRYQPYYENMLKMIDNARMTNPDAILSFSVPPQVLTLESQSNRRSDAPAGPSNPLQRPTGRSLVRTVSSRDVGSMLRAIPTGTRYEGLTDVGSMLRAIPTGTRYEGLTDVGSMLRAIPTGTRYEGLTDVKEEGSSGTSGETRKKRVHEDGQGSSADNEERRDAKRRKIKREDCN